MSRARRATRTLAVSTAAVLALGLAPSPALADQPAYPASDFLVSQLQDGLFVFDSYGFPYTDFGGSIDGEIALDAIGAHESDVTAIANAVSSRLSEYTDYSYTDGGSTYTGRSAGGTAKAIVALQVAGQDPTTHPDGNLVTRLEGLTDADGRIGDAATKDGQPYPDGDYANVFGQTFAVTALRNAGSSEALRAAAFLGTQQCAGAGGGYFTESFTSAPCAVPADASVDATALAVNAFVPLYGDGTQNSSAFVLTKAMNYFLGVQRSDGAFVSGPDAVANANSTGLAVAALQRLARVNPTFEHYAAPMAEKGAAWLRAQQLVNVGPCAPYRTADLGAVAYDPTARAGAAKDGITAATQGQFIKATTQSTEGLLSAPEAAGALKATLPTTYVADGATVTLKTTSAAPGSSVCQTSTAVQKPTSVTGSAVFSVKAPAGRNAVTTFYVKGVDGTTAKAVLRSLGPKTLGLRLRSQVVRGGEQRVIVSGLARGEKVSIRTGGTTVKTGTANSSGVLDTTFKASTIPGTKTVTVYGQFTDRKASKTYTVVR